MRSDHDRAAQERDLPPVEILRCGGTNDELGNDEGPRWRVESWRAHPVASAASVTLLLAAVAVVVVQQSSAGNEDDGRNALREWASGQHDDGDPPAGVVLPDPTCDEDPHDHVAVRTCLREAQRIGTPASGHLRADMSYPEALDHWFTIDVDGRVKVTERFLTVTHRPDVEGSGTIQPSQLTSTTVSWRTWTCEQLVFADEADVYPGVECQEVLDGGAQPPDFEHTEVRDLTDVERRELVRAFACTHPDELSEDDC